MPNALRRCTLHQFSKGNNQLYLYMLYKYKQLLSTSIAHSISLQRNRVYCWKWSSSPSASVQISVHSPVQVLHLPSGQTCIGPVSPVQRTVRANQMHGSSHMTARVRMECTLMTVRVRVRSKYSPWCPMEC